MPVASNTRVTPSTSSTNDNGRGWQREADGDAFPGSLTEYTWQVPGPGRKQGKVTCQVPTVGVRKGRYQSPFSLPNLFAPNE